MIFWCSDYLVSVAKPPYVLAPPLPLLSNPSELSEKLPPGLEVLKVYQIIYKSQLWGWRFFAFFFFPVDIIITISGWGCYMCSFIGSTKGHWCESRGFHVSPPHPTCLSLYKGSSTSSCPSGSMPLASMVTPPLIGTAGGGTLACSSVRSWSCTLARV